MDDRLDLAMEILSRAKRKKENGEKLSQVEAVILREWLTVLTSRLAELEIQEERQSLSDIQKAEMQGISFKIEKYG